MVKISNIITLPIINPRFSKYLIKIIDLHEVKGILQYIIIGKINIINKMSVI